MIANNDSRWRVKDRELSLIIMGDNAVKIRICHDCIPSNQRIMPHYNGAISNHFYGIAMDMIPKHHFSLFADRQGAVITNTTRSLKHDLS